jgi:hypothetical protein
MKVIISDRISRFIDRQVPEADRLQLRTAIEELDSEKYFRKENPERIAAAIVLVYLQTHDIESPIYMAREDYRDLLMASEGLEHANWPDVIEERFGPA